MPTRCNELCNIARDLNSTAITQYVTLKMRMYRQNISGKLKKVDVYVAIYIVAAEFEYGNFISYKTSSNLTPMFLIMIEN